MGQDATRGFDYAVVDVFAESALAGNPLAVFTDARGLTDAEMQALARETNLAETTFILPASDAEIEERDGVRMRIFTVQEELAFAGHPTLGTASWLYWNHPTLRGSEKIMLRQNAGPITVAFEPTKVDLGRAFGTMKQQDPVFGGLHDRGEVAKVLNMSPEDLAISWPIQTVSTGIPFCIVPMKSVDAVGRLAIPQASAQAYLDRCDAKFFFCVAPAAQGSGVDFHNRMQFYNGEDPATGSASGCAISYLVRHGFVPSGKQVLFEQGVEMKRPSKVHVRATLDGGKVIGVFVGGRTIYVASGRFFLP